MAQPVLGIVAGSGSLPGLVIQGCRDQGRDFHVVALKGFAEPAVIGDAPATWIRIGAGGSGLSKLREVGAAEIVMIGGVKRPGLFDLRPDWVTTRFMARVGWAALGDDGLLRAVVAMLEAEGFRVVGVDEVLTGLLAPEGELTTTRPDEIARIDIRRGIDVVRGLGDLDIGQAAVIQQGLVLGVEAIEGTDALMERCAALARPGPGGILVKLRKPGQERRVDLPTIGVTTVEKAARFRLRGIVVEAGGTLVIDRPAVVAKANALGLFVSGVSPTDPAR